MAKRKDLKLKVALNRQKGANYTKDHQKKLRQEAEKLKRAAAQQQKPVHDEDEDIGDEDDSDGGIMLVTEEDGTSRTVAVLPDEEEDEEGSSDEDVAYDMNALDDDSSIYTSDEGEKEEKDQDEPESDHSEDEEDIPLSDLESLSDTEKGDLVPHQRLTINNHAALTSALNRISLPYAKLPFSAHQSITADTTTSNAIPDPEDDLNRELQFYNQAQSAAELARQKLKKEGVPFSRPNDFFAEMVKSDEHMGRIKTRLVEDATAKKAALEARKLRDAKKFGKKVQVEKEQERAKERREMKGKVESLKRKRQGAPIANEKEEDMFDIALEKEAPRRRSDGPGKRGGADANPKRQKKDDKYGFGGKKRFSKSGDATSTSDMRGFSAKGMKSNEFGGSSKVKKARPGKSKRQKGRP
ncbi:Ebp2-domain-containing protein [Eremomyces bilateralis CBS 781.70]|uniref:Ebp2-domain-containing protein n=1 Tax=Eremomyces bilateralis CBS 781.70 TaxID=1392243 RepID=A0A6G1GD20_9PEZI|nr:Ebp2-domain-containing protein [Eremomyces bilateralis CBS 781.70]KAF1815800.1 Ebp2-domain-containing protein [Eremomyces bilateralis CBS 781.70]